ncbi:MULTISPECIES: pantetheine-phosphate adenylyltransferase [Vagococcus]|uniref:Phosphopantetheine adenylyltransferase n=1 Tax=Vagococcus fluvialis bH819 TaxID=1255619 RepID=A0A1X6WQT3_9ENTE|nr:MULTISPECIES: pantetheine-phosphate adenylyltransferase [Vagococcus]SLM86693.1 Phosphopantetheine adenylyltransferase [Vagococcus fluvialis bH819]HCM90901.1 pantetheine-phosphate adenylyltransferase [Vagococcus sp.]
MVDKRIALFPGSFDPFTNGHLNTVERASILFDEVIIGIFTNTTKKPLFTAEEKKKLTEKAVSQLSNVRVILQSEGLTIHIAKELQANFLIRGVRNNQDYEYEKNIASMNRTMDGSIDTIFLLADDNFSNISSSMIKEIAKFKGDVSSFVPTEVNKALIEKFR